jgi:hypothetical protein
VYHRLRLEIKRFSWYSFMSKYAPVAQLDRAFGFGPKGSRFDSWQVHHNNFMSFTRNVENFVCERCGHKVQGNGYTNHCPKCLWSKHVDNEPGDRASACHGMMEPMGIRQKDSQTDILHHCTLCGLEKWNHVTKDDDSDIISALSANPI